MEIALKNAVKCGLLPDKFWDMTPAELNLIIEVYIEKQKEARKADVTASFYTAYFSRIDKLSGSDLNKVLDVIDGTNKKEMTDEEMLNAVKGYVSKIKK